MSTRKRKENFWGFVLIGPLLIGIIIFNVFPFFENIFFSFTNLGRFGLYRLTGFDNYIYFFKDEQVLNAFWNTFKYVILGVPCIIILSLILAALLNQKIKGKGIYRTLLFLPAVTMPSAIAMIWKWLYNYDFGIINTMLNYIGIHNISWLGNADIIFWSVLIVLIWSGIGYNMIILLAGLQCIPPVYYEAAEIDGAGPIRKFFSITIPMLTPTLFFVTITSVIGTIQVFDIILLLVGKTNLVQGDAISGVYVFYKYAFILQEKGFAAAIALILFILTLIVTLILLKLQKKWVHYQ
ncbi:MAG TPA: sugar ABC transporter permease [Victivallales bacterium]|nr:sugar ABC transporter permease [Victivallales bacterium]